MTELREVRHFHLFAGLGGGALGFNRGRAAVNGLRAEFRCIGGVDSDPAACADFTSRTGTWATHLDLFTRKQYRIFHGKQPPADWREATAADLRRAAGNLRPHIIFTSPPCKGFSGLLSSTKAAEPKYAALNALTLRGVELALEAWGDDPPEFFILENVPRITSRGRGLLDDIRDRLEAAGYSVAETTHDCGEVGGLAQTRKRFLLVARHSAKVPPFLYEPPKHPLRSVGEVLEGFPLPGDPRAGPMHAMRRLHWRTLVRLALIPAGGDWRDLRNLEVEDGYLRDLAIVPTREYFGGAFGVMPWDATSGTVAGETLPSNGAFSVADPRTPGRYRGSLGVTPWDETASTVTTRSAPNNGPFAVADPRAEYSGAYSQLGVREWSEAAGTVTSQASPGQGPISIADPRTRAMVEERLYGNSHRVTGWDESTGVVIGATRPGSGAGSVSDPRIAGVRHNNVYRVVPWAAQAQAVTAGGGPSSGGQAVADPRLGLSPDRDWSSSGHYGVIGWDETARTVTASGNHGNGRGSVADPRLPEATDRVDAMIIALDGTCHRPFTTFDLAALQGLVTPEDLDLGDGAEPFSFEGASDTAHRQRIGNAVPPPAAAAMASVMAHALLLAWSGETFALGSTPIWARPHARAISVEANR